MDYNYNKVYAVDNFTTNPNPKAKFPLATLKGDQNRRYYLKDRSYCVAGCISDVKLSELGNAIDPTLVGANVLCTYDGDKESPHFAKMYVASQKVLDDGATGDNDDTLDNIFYRRENLRKVYCGERAADPFIFQNASLRAVMERLPAACAAQDFKDALASQYLLSHALGIGDTFGGNNVPIYYDTNGQEFKVGKSFDFEVGLHIVNEDNDEREHFNKDIFWHAYPFLKRCAIPPANIEFLKAETPAATEKFIDNMLSTKPKLGKIFDPTHICNEIDGTVEKFNHRNMAKFYNRGATIRWALKDTPNNYSKRFDALANNFTKGYTTQNGRNLAISKSYALD
jgi:hypothetical protein